MAKEAEPFTPEHIGDRASTLRGALAYFQQHLPRVAKGETAVIEGTTKEGKPYTKRYDYAQLDDVSEAILTLLGKLGLSWSCMPTLRKLEGENGHRFVLEYELAHDTDPQVKTGIWPLPDRANPQDVGTVITYARRYCLCSVTGVAPGGDDDDGARGREAASTGERLSTASELSLPPGDTDHLVAALEPQALTPLANYWPLWEIVTKRRAADKPSPVEHDGGVLTWKQLFGFALAQRIEQLETPAQCRAFFEEAKAAGGNPRLPWTWEGMNAADRLTARGKHLNNLLDEAARVADLALASASSIEELDKAAEMVRALDGKIAPERIQSLGEFRNQREEELRRATEPMEHDEPAPLDGPDDDTAPPSGEAYERLRAQIWKGGSLPELNDELNGAVERGEITQENFAELTVMLFERPERAAGAYTWFMWQLNGSTNEPALDAVRDDTKAAEHEGELTNEEARSIYSVIAAKRIDLKGLAYR